MSSNSFIQVVAIWLAIYLLPLMAGAFGVAMAIKGRAVWVRALSSLIAVAGLIAFSYIMVTATPYLWASHLESRWRPARPETKMDLESHLSLYSKYEITPAESSWGRYHVLDEGDRMIRYMILWNAPLDVVYNASNHIVRIFTSYE